MLGQYQNRYHPLLFAWLYFNYIVSWLQGRSPLSWGAHSNRDSYISYHRKIFVYTDSQEPFLLVRIQARARDAPEICGPRQRTAGDFVCLWSPVPSPFRCSRRGAFLKGSRFIRQTSNGLSSACWTTEMKQQPPGKNKVFKLSEVEDTEL